MSLDQHKRFVKHQTATRDRFLGGKLTLSQPGNGFRAGLDSVLLGAATGEGRKTVLDLGCGVGTAAFVALANDPERTATLIDQNREMLDHARQNAADNALGARTTILTGDVTAKGEDRQAAGLRDNAYDSVIANPPFFADGTLSSDSGRAGARHMQADALDRWIKTAAGAAAPRGEVIFIYPVASLPILLAGFAARFGALAILPLCPRPGEAASRVLIRGIKGSRAPLTLLPSRALHDAESRHFAADFDAIFRGTACLRW